MTARPSPSRNHPRGPSPRDKGGHTAHRGKPSSPSTADASDTTRQLYGIHAIEAALRNPSRIVTRLYLTENAERRLADALKGNNWPIERVRPKDLDRKLGADTVHQGAAADVEPLPEWRLTDLALSGTTTDGPLLVLDQVTDPHNVGAILRSAAVFGARGLVMTRRHSPPPGATLAKSASGALEAIPIAFVQNLGDALQDLSGLGYRIIGLDGEAETLLEETDLTGNVALILGAEGKGLRARTRECCHSLCRISTPGPIASLNVSNAAAVALHLAAMRRRAITS